MDPNKPQAVTEKSRARLSNAMDRKAHMAGDLGVSLRLTNFLWEKHEQCVCLDNS